MSDKHYVHNTTHFSKYIQFKIKSDQIKAISNTQMTQSVRAAVITDYLVQK